MLLGNFVGFYNNKDKISVFDTFYFITFKGFQCSITQYSIFTLI